MFRRFHYIQNDFSVFYYTLDLYFKLMSVVT